MDKAKLRCPFVYANGRRCEGHVYQARAYGPQRDGHLIEVRKVRFWCSEKGDHVGTARGFWGKERMEFYPDQIPEDLKGVLGLFEGRNHDATF